MNLVAVLNYFFVIPMLPTYTGDNPFAKPVDYLHVQADKHDKTSTCMLVCVRSLSAFLNYCSHISRDVRYPIASCPKQVSSSNWLTIVCGHNSPVQILEPKPFENSRVCS